MQQGSPMDSYPMTADSPMPRTIGDRLQEVEAQGAQQREMIHALSERLDTAESQLHTLLYQLGLSVPTTAKASY